MAKRARRWKTPTHGLAALAAGAGAAAGAAPSEAALIHTVIGCTLSIAVDRTCSIDVTGDLIPDLNVTSESVTRAYGTGLLTYRRIVANGTGSTTITGEEGSADPNGTVPRFEASSTTRGSAAGGEGRSHSSGGSEAVLQATAPAAPAQFNGLDGEAFLEVTITSGDPPVENIAWIRILGDAGEGTLTFLDSLFETDPGVRPSLSAFPLLDEMGWPLTEPLSNLGVQQLDAEIQAVPLPGSIALMAAGAVSVLALRRLLRTAGPA